MSVSALNPVHSSYTLPQAETKTVPPPTQPPTVTTHSDSVTISSANVHTTQVSEHLDASDAH